jgi:hypothetical protein
LTSMATIATPPAPAPPAAAPEEIIVNEEDPMKMVLEQEDAEPELSPSRMMDDLDDLDNPTEANYDVDE